MHFNSVMMIILSSVSAVEFSENDILIGLRSTSLHFLMKTSFGENVERRLINKGRAKLFYF